MDRFRGLRSLSSAPAHRPEFRRRALLGGHPGHDSDARADARGHQSPVRDGTAGATRGEPPMGTTSRRHMCPMNARSAVSRSDVIAGTPWGAEDTRPRRQRSEDRTSTLDSACERASRHVSHREDEDDHDRDDHVQGGHGRVRLHKGNRPRRWVEARPERRRPGDQGI